ncbi:MAG: hypothetical protein UHM08_05245 [Bacteroidales bacterium]|nr:hypothetical protein [Bacteroidales bacterium]
MQQKKSKIWLNITHFVLIFLFYGIIILPYNSDKILDNSAPEQGLRIFFWEAIDV